jgi:hypothetical protein
MTITVGTDTYISVVDAKTLAEKLSDEGELFSVEADSTVEKYLVRAMYEIEDLTLKGSRYSSGQALQFPRAYYNNVEDPDGTTIISRVQVMNAIDLFFGGKRNSDMTITRGDGAYDDASPYSPLASVEGYMILRKAGYLASPNLEANFQSGAQAGRINTVNG